MGISVSRRKVSSDTRGAQGAPHVVDRLGYLPLRKDEVAARLVGGDGPDVVVFEGGQPALSAAVGVGDQNGRPQRIEESGNGRYVYPDVQRTGIGGHLPEELIECLRFARELDAGVKFPIGAEAEDAEPELVVRGATCSRPDGSCDRPGRGPVDQVGRPDSGTAGRSSGNLHDRRE